MKDKSLNFKNLSKKGLVFLKEKYIKEKVNSMKIEELKEFVTENISQQVKDTIGDDEENEAWEEMKNFFNDQFISIIEEIQTKFPINDLLISTKEETDHEKRQRMLEISNKEKNKTDMWED